METKEYWNLPKADDVVQRAITVVEGHAEKIIYGGLEVTEWTALLSLLVASISIFIAWKASELAKNEAFFNRKHNELSVVPHLALTINSDVRTRSIEWSLKNNGVGPAVIDRFSLLFSGIRLTQNNLDSNNLDMSFFQGKISRIDDLNLSLISNFPYYISASDSPLSLLKITIQEKEDERHEDLSRYLLSCLELIQVQVSYTDVYENRLPDVISLGTD
jgi:hypothetical protein|tara:strand:+ start:237 stop:890 length:654 start_codon:yes stop_codon:yes gene_type:complete